MGILQKMTLIQVQIIDDSLAKIIRFLRSPKVSKRSKQHLDRILAEAFSHSKESEAIHLAAVSA